MTLLTCDPSSESPRATKERRRGTTMMEYLVMISMILVVVLVAVGYLGGVNNNSMSGSSNAINKAMKKGS